MDLGACSSSGNFLNFTRVSGRSIFHLSTNQRRSNSRSHQSLLHQRTVATTCRPVGTTREEGDGVRRIQVDDHTTHRDLQFCDEGGETPEDHEGLSSDSIACSVSVGSRAGIQAHQHHFVCGRCTLIRCLSCHSTYFIIASWVGYVPGQRSGQCRHEPRKGPLRDAVVAHAAEIHKSRDKLKDPRLVRDMAADVAKILSQVAWDKNGQDMANANESCLVANVFWK